MDRALTCTNQVLDDLESEGKIEASYHVIEYQRNLLIVNVESDGELTEIISEDPMFFHSTRKGLPLPQERPLRNTYGR